MFIVSIKVIKPYHIGTINVMKYVKILNDYSKNSLESTLAAYLTSCLDTSICFEEIKNIKFKIKYIKPVHDFIIYTTAVTGQAFCSKRV